MCACVKRVVEKRTDYRKCDFKWTNIYGKIVRDRFQRTERTKESYVIRKKKKACNERMKVYWPTRKKRKKKS